MKYILFVFVFSVVVLTAKAQQDFHPHIHEIQFGLENFGKTPSINGGNYAYVGYTLQLVDRMAVGAKLSSDLVPHSFNDGLASFHLRFNSKMRGEHNLQKQISLLYMTDLKKSQTNQSFVGTKISMLNITADNAIIEFLPLTVLYGLDSKKVSLGYSILGLSITI